MTLLIVVYTVSAVIWFILASLACYMDWKRGLDQDAAHLCGILLASFVPIINTGLIIETLFGMLKGVKLKGKRK